MATSPLSSDGALLDVGLVFNAGAGCTDGCGDIGGAVDSACTVRTGPDPGEDKGAAAAEFALTERDGGADEAVSVAGAGAAAAAVVKATSGMDLGGSEGDEGAARDVASGAAGRLGAVQFEEGARATVAASGLEIGMTDTTRG